jgi:hypothetical protein
MAMTRKLAISKPAKFKVANCDLGRIECVKQQIFVVRGQRVMFDNDLAKLYGVSTKRLNEQLRRNLKRFPKDFAFQLTLTEAKAIAASRLQNATLKQGKNIKHAPHVFTEHGAIMLASVLNSPVAVHASVFVVRAFVQMRAALLEYAELSRKIDKLAATYDYRFQQVFDAIRELMALPLKPKRQIGFIGTTGKRRKVDQ